MTKENTVNMGERLGAIIALDVNYCEDRFGIDSDVQHPVLMECAADFAAYCLMLGHQIENHRVRLQSEGDFYPVDVAEEMAMMLNNHKAKTPLPDPEEWTRLLCFEQFEFNKKLFGKD